MAAEKITAPTGPGWSQLLLDVLNEDQKQWLQAMTMEDLTTYLEKADELFFQESLVIYEARADRQTNDYLKNVELQYEIAMITKDRVNELIGMLGQYPNSLDSLIAKYINKQRLH